MREELRKEKAERALAEYGQLLKDARGPIRDPECSECNDTGSITEKQSWSADQARPCPFCSTRLRAETLQRISGLNEDERAIRLIDISTTAGATDKMLVKARRFLIKRSGIFTLWGGSGNGKTLVLQAIVNECLEQNVTAVYTTFFELVGYVRAAFKDRSESALQRVERFQSVPVLCIDEFDKVKETDWVEELETAIIDKRYRDGLAGLCGTVIAMNNDPATLPAWIYSRLRDGRNSILCNTDADMRPLMEDEVPDA